MRKTDHANLLCLVQETPLGKIEVVRAKGIDNSFPRHAHHSYCLGLVEKGCRLILQQKGLIAIPEGGLFIIQPGQSHSCRSPRAECHSYNVICLPKRAMALAASRLGRSHGQAPHFHKILLDDKSLAAAFRAFLNMLSHNISGPNLLSTIQDLMAGLISRHASPSPPAQAKGGRQKSPEEKARCFLEYRFADQVTLEVLANWVGSSPFHLQRRFVKSLGCSPKEYLLQHRIKVARRLLLKGLPLSQVALETGFYDQGHFTNRFKTVMGVTPGRFYTDNHPTVSN